MRTLQRKPLAIIAALAVSAALGILLIAAPASAFALDSAGGIPVRACDVSQADSGKVLVGLKGSFEQTSAEKILAKINEIRKEACEEGVWDPRNPSRKLTASDYVPLVWSSDLEYITLLRSAEASITIAHERADGSSIWIKAPSGKQGYAEDLAWCGNLLQGINLFYGEKSYWVKQDSSAVTGHYTSMINPSYTSVGVSGFIRSSDTAPSYSCTVAMQLSPELPTSQERIVPNGELYQLVQMKAESVKSVALKGLDNSVAAGSSRQAYVTGKVTYDANIAKNSLIDASFDWSSSDTGVATVSSSGLVCGVAAGKSTITAQLGSLAATAQVTVGGSSAGDGDSSITVDELAYAKAKVVKGKAKKTTKAQAGPAKSTSGLAISYSKVSGPAKVSVSKKGVITIKKGLKKGRSYTFKVKATCAGATKQVKITIKIR